MLHFVFNSNFCVISRTKLRLFVSVNLGLVNCKYLTDFSFVCQWLVYKTIPYCLLILNFVCFQNQRAGVTCCAVTTHHNASGTS